MLAKSSESLERDYWYTVSRASGRARRRRRRWARKPRGARCSGSTRGTLSTRKVPVLYPAELAKGLFGHLIAAIRGTAQYRRASFLARCGRPSRSCRTFIDIDEDPWIPRALASAPFDAEGVRRGSGGSSSAACCRATCCRATRRVASGLPTTGNAGGVHNLLVKPTAGTLADLIKDCEEAFVVGELLGQGVNTVTGDYSRGAAGFWVERGEIVHPVHEVTIAGNLKDLFREIQAVGSDIDERGTVRCGAVRVDGLTLAGGG